MKLFEWLVSEEGKQKKWLDIVAVGGMAIIWLLEAYLSNHWWGTKKSPFVVVTWGHLTFPLFSIGLPVLWFFVVRKYPLSYLGINRAKRRFWYFIAPLGAVLGFAFGIPTYLLM